MKIARLVSVSFVVALFVGCSAPAVDNSEENMGEARSLDTPPLSPMSDGPPACSPGQIVCSSWQGTTQVFGKCARGACCLGCLDGRGTCHTIDSADACGISGSVCKNCDDDDPCTSDGCDTGACVHAKYADAIPCSEDGLKHCLSGVCQ